MRTAMLLAGAAAVVASMLVVLGGTVANGSPAPDSAQGYRQAFDDLPDSQWGGADQATTVPLPDGRTVWLFGDTLGPGYFSHNSIVVQDGGSFTVKRPAIPDGLDGVYHWPMHGVVDGGYLNVFVFRVKSDAAKGFIVVGTAIARFSLPGLQYLSLHPTPSYSTPDTNTHWGVATTKVGSYIYVYGNKRIDAELVFGKRGYVARVPVGKLSQLSQWRYWDGATWSPYRTRAAKVLDENRHGTSTNFSVYKDARGWVIVHKKYDVFGEQIVSLRSANPYGPWTEKLLATVAPWTEQHSTYNAAAHPHLGLASGKTLVSIAHNDQNVFSDFSLYRPEFFELVP